MGGRRGSEGGGLRSGSCLCDSGGHIVDAALGTAEVRIGRLGWESLRRRCKARGSLGIIHTNRIILPRFSHPECVYLYTTFPPSVGKASHGYLRESIACCRTMFLVLSIIFQCLPLCRGALQVSVAGTRKSWLSQCSVTAVRKKKRYCGVSVLALSLLQSPAQ